MADSDRAEIRAHCDRETWESWKDTVPRSVHIPDALQALIERDLQRKTQSQRDADELDRDASVLALRIRHKTRAALSSLGDDPDLEAVRENIKDIQEIADILEG